MRKFLGAFVRPQFWQQAGLGLGLVHMIFGAELALSIGVTEQLIKKGQGLPVETLVIAPDQAQAEDLPVVVMNHGFLLSQMNYREIMAETAKAGFVVLAPQTHAAGGLPFGKPTTEKEAQLTGQVITWFSTRLEGIVGQGVDFERIGLLNHSRGSKIAWTIQRDGLAKVKAIAAIDPVDGDQDGSPRVTGGSFRMELPVLLIGSGLGGSCAPADRNYRSFWAAAKASPAWLYVAEDFGHLDMLDNSNCGLVCGVCTKASSSVSRTELKQWIGKAVGQFMRGILYQDEASLDKLDATVANLRLTREKR
jgi:chlorophyllase